MHMRATGMLLKVRSMLAFTPGGGSNTKMRPARSRFTGTWEHSTDKVTTENLRGKTGTPGWLDH